MLFVRKTLKLVWMLSGGKGQLVCTAMWAVCVGAKVMM